MASGYLSLFVNTVLIAGFQRANVTGDLSRDELHMFSEFELCPFGNQLHAREFANQKMETMIACGVQNRFTGLGMPKSYRTT